MLGFLLGVLVGMATIWIYVESQRKVVVAPDGQKRKATDLESAYAMVNEDLKRKDLEYREALTQRGEYVCGFKELPDISLAKKPRIETIGRCNLCGGQVVPCLLADGVRENRCASCKRPQMNWKPANKMDKPAEESKP